MSTFPLRVVIVYVFRNRGVYVLIRFLVRLLVLDCETMYLELTLAHVFVVCLCG